ncbi:MAG TPA: hypothetical protein VGY53_09360 [Isosphaeraceae bacterium]|nr:hypothetical protein [Isosphaeraceae bacterium]
MRIRTGLLATAGVTWALLASAMLCAQEQNKNSPPPNEARVQAKHQSNDTVFPREVFAQDEPAVAKGDIPKKRAAVAKKVVPKPVVDANEQANALELAELARPHLRVEYEFVRIVCHPGKDERKAIASAGERALRSAAAKAAHEARRGERALSSPRKTIQEGLVAAVKAHLSPAQAAAYANELEERNASRKRAALLSLLSRLQNDLRLSADQRDKIRDSLAARWDESWENIMQMYLSGQFSYPPALDQSVNAVLSKEQQKIWRSLPKGELSIWNNPNESTEGLSGDDDLDEAMKAEGRFGQER